MNTVLANKEKEEITVHPRSSAARLSLAAVITAFDEGDEVRKTVESLAGSIKGEQTTRRTIVVDDGSKDGSCNDVATCSNSVAVLRHETPEGVGRSRNAGCAAALQAGADAVSFHDGHMRFTPSLIPPPMGEGKGEGVLEALARKAIETGAIVCSAAKGWWYAEGDADVVSGKHKAGEEHAFHAWGADLHWNGNDGLQPKYRIYVDWAGQSTAVSGQQSAVGKGTKAESRELKADSSNPPEADWMRVPCPMGACYVMSRETIRRLMEPTGRLWEDVAGRWGFSEQALAVKAFLLDIPILVSRDLATHHHYRAKNPVPNAGTEIWRNVCFAMAALLSKETFDQRFLRYCQIRLGEKEADRLYDVAQAPRDGDVAATRPLVGTSAVLGGGASVTKRPWDVEKERRIFTDLCGRGAPITGAHPEHTWLTELESAAREIRRTAGRPLRILQWRPGESTLLLASWLPNSQLTCLEWEKHRISNWAPILQDLPGVSLLRVPLEIWADPVAGGLVKKDEQFDLITIGGEMQEECRSAAERLRGPGGQIVINPTADRLQIADEYRREATDELTAFLKPKGQPSAISGQLSAREKIINLERRLNPEPRTLVTVVLLNWQRPEAIGPILDCLARQTVKPKIVLWNNGDPVNISGPHGSPIPLEKHPAMSLVVQSMSNLGCMPRWWLASLADTEFVCSFDDDLVLADERVLEDAIEAQRTLCPDGIVGFFGWEAVPGKDYLGAKHVNGSAEDRRVDVIKGRFMVLQTRLLQRVLLAHPALFNSSEQLAVSSNQSLLTTHSAFTTHSSLLRRCDDIYVSFCIAQGERGRHLVPGVLGKRWKEIGAQDGRGLALQPGHYHERDQMVNLMMNHYWGEPRKGA